MTTGLPELRAVLDLCDLAVVIVAVEPGSRADPTILHLNRAAAELLGFTAAQLSGRSLRILRAPSTPRAAFAVFLDTVRDGTGSEDPSVGLATGSGGEVVVRVRRSSPSEAPQQVVLWLSPQLTDARGVTAPMPLAPRLWSGLGRDVLYLQAVAADLSTRFVWVDEGLATLLGLGGEDLDAQGGLASLVLPESHDDLRLHRQLLLSGGTSSVTLRIRGAGGLVLHVRDSARPVLDGQGVVRAIAGALAPAMGDDRRERQRRTIERTAEALAPLAPGRLIVLDERGPQVWRHGRDGGSERLSELLAAPELDRWLALIDESLLLGRAVTGPVRWFQDPDPLVGRVTMVPVEAGYLMALFTPDPLLLAAPVAGARLGEPASPVHGLRSSVIWSEPARSTSLADAVAEPVLAVDEQGLIAYVNQAGSELAGRSASELLGQSIDDLLFRPSGPAAPVWRFLQDRPTAVFEHASLHLLLPSGEPVPLEVAVQRLVSADRTIHVLTLRDATLRQQTEETLRSLAYHDPLTGLPNRLVFQERLAQALERGRKARRLVGVLLVDLDRFTLINDSLGLEKGDQVLRSIAERIAKVARPDDTLARLGGDQFMLLMTDLASAETAALAAQQVLELLRPALRVNGHELSLSASVGVALFPQDGDDTDTLVKNAGTALARAKEQGRDHYQLYTTDMNATAFERLMLENRLRKALDQQELVVFYQPQVSLETGRVVGVEALLRWFHPELGLVPPGEFIALAEETGLIVPIGGWVLADACAQMRRWQDELGRSDLTLGINLSARQFQQQDLVTMIAQVLEKTGLPPRCLELELTESVVMRDAMESVRRLRDLTALGVQLAIDDFGTGYSSLAYLRTFPIRSLKIDRSFVQDVDRDPSSATIVQTIVAMGHSLDLRLVAEGVETSQQLRQLRRLGCHELQGFLISRAVPADNAFRLIRDGRLVGDEFALA